jgi:hypothetical protein
MGCSGVRPRRTPLESAADLGVSARVSRAGRGGVCDIAYSATGSASHTGTGTINAFVFATGTRVVARRVDEDS